MSQPERDPLSGLIQELTASMDGSRTDAGAAPEQVGSRPGQPYETRAEIQAPPAIDLGSDGALEGFRGLADELLLEVGRRASPELRDALAEHIGAGIVAGLLGNEGKSDPTQRVILEVSAALLGGGLLDRLQESIDLTRQAEVPPQMGPIARWRHERKVGAENKAAERAAYVKRQEEVRRLRVQTVERGCMDASDFKPGDTVTIKMRNHSSERWKAEVVLALSVEGHEEVAEGRTSGVRLTVVKESRGTDGRFLHDPLPPDASVVIRGTALPQNNYMPKVGRLRRDDALVLLWEGQQMPFLTQCRIDHASGSVEDRERNLRLDQITINDITMFAE